MLGGIRFYAGQSMDNMLGRAVQISNTVPREWTTVRIDLIEANNNNPTIINNMIFGTVGAGAKFDKIVLYRTFDLMMQGN
jgi:hypothetical protein